MVEEAKGADARPKDTIYVTKAFTLSLHSVLPQGDAKDGTRVQMHNEVLKRYEVGEHEVGTYLLPIWDRKTGEVIRIDEVPIATHPYVVQHCGKPPTAAELEERRAKLDAQIETARAREAAAQAQSKKDADGLTPEKVDQFAQDASAAFASGDRTAAAANDILSVAPNTRGTGGPEVRPNTRSR